MSIKIENVDIHGWEAAIRSCRNPMNSMPIIQKILKD